MLANAEDGTTKVLPARDWSNVDNLAWFANGTMAMETGVSSPPKNPTTPSRCTSSRAATTPLAGLLSSSRTTSATFLPSTC